MHGTAPKPRLLMVCHRPPPLHGAAVMGEAAATSQALQALFDVTVIAISLNAGVKSASRFGLGKLLPSLRLIFEVARAVAAKRPAALYLTANISGFAFWRDLIIVTIARLAGVHRIYHFHMKGVRGQFQRSALMRAAYRWMFAGADVIHLSSRLYRDVEPVVPPERFHVVANGIDVAPAAPVPAAGDVPTVLFLSNLYESKGPLDLLEASRRVRESGVAHNLVFAGAAPDRAVVERIQASGAGVSWCGPVEGERKAALLNQADVFVFPSWYHFECQPLVVIEAMAHGKAIIASDEAAIPDLVVDNESGLIVPSRAVDEIAADLDLLLTYPALRARFGAAARAAYERTFTAAAFDRRLADTLWRLCVLRTAEAVVPAEEAA